VLTKEFVNDFDEKIEFSCPGNKVLAGANSIHHNKEVEV